jgi:hypothetical protein
MKYKRQLGKLLFVAPQNLIYNWHENVGLTHLILGGKGIPCD